MRPSEWTSLPALRSTVSGQLARVITGRKHGVYDEKTRMSLRRVRTGSRTRPRDQRHRRGRPRVRSRRARAALSLDRRK